MIHATCAQAIRDRMLTLSVATTGSTSLGATGATFTRAAGSFLTDGFAAGMEVTATGFTTAAGPYVVKKVTATVLTVDETLATETASAGRTIAAGLPAARAYENVPLEPTTGDPWFREQYIPGPSYQATLGTNGDVEYRPQYAAQIHVPENTGPEAARKYADAILDHFQPGQGLTAGSSTLHVRTDISPSVGQMLRTGDGWVVVPVTIPFWVRTARTN